MEIYDKPFTCISRLAELRNEKVMIILSIVPAEPVVSIVHNERNVFRIYLYSNDPKISFEKQHEYSKVHGYYSENETLVSRILVDINIFTIEASRIAKLVDENPLTNTFQPESSICLLDNSAEFGSAFVLFRIYLDLLLSSQELRNISCIENASNICRRYYQDNVVALKRIDELEQSYTSEEAIYWYLRDSCLYRLTWKALREFNVDLILGFGFFIADLYMNLQKLSLEQDDARKNLFKVYRGSILSLNEIESLKNNIHHLISINSFLSTTTNIEIARIFADSYPSSNLQSVLFEISIDTDTSSRLVFVDLSRISMFPDENEVLFVPGCIFKVVSCQYEDGLWRVQLSTTDTMQDEADKLINEFKEKLDTPINYISFGMILSKYSRWKEAEQYYTTLLDQPSIPQKDIIEIRCNLSNCYFLQQKYDLALQNYQNVMNECIKTDTTSNSLMDKFQNMIQSNQDISRNLKIVAEIHFNIGYIEQSLNKYDSALCFYEKALEIQKDNNLDYSHTVKIYEAIGDIHSQKGDNELALSYFNKSLDINESSMALQHHSNINEIYRKMGDIYRRLNDSENALKCYQQALETLLKMLSSNHPLINTYLHNIVQLKKECSKIVDMNSTTKRLKNLDTSDDQEEMITTKNSF